MYTYSKPYWRALYLHNTIVVLYFIQSMRGNPHRRGLKEKEKKMTRETLV